MRYIDTISYSSWARIYCRLPACALIDGLSLSIAAFFSSPQIGLARTFKCYFRRFLHGLILFSCCGLLVPASAATLTIAFGEFKPPYIFGREARGLEVDIFREALKYKGHALKVVHIPDSRRYTALADQTLQLDGVATVGLRSGYFYSDDFIAYQNYVITRKEDGHEITRIEDLQGVSVVAWQHAWAELGSAFALLFSPDAQGASRQNYYESPSQRAQVGMFWRKRVDAVVMDRKIFIWLSGEHLGRTNVQQQVTFHPVLAKFTRFKAAFVNQQVRDDFNAGLAHIKKNGAYRRLVDAYTPASIRP